MMRRIRNSLIIVLSLSIFAFSIGGILRNKLCSVCSASFADETYSPSESITDASGYVIENMYRTRTFIDNVGHQIDEIVVPGRPPAIKAKSVKVPKSNPSSGISVLSNVPAFDWAYGCSATSAAMLFGYYDNNGFPNMYTGSANGGVCPMDNSIWGITTYPSGTVSECPLSASHQGVDGRTTRGHVDDYWIDYGNADPDPYIANGWDEHAQGECTGDFMGTNQSKYENSDGSTTFYFYPSGDPLYDYTVCEPDHRDGCHGLRLFAESRGYTVISNYNQYIKGQGSNPNKGFTFDDFKNEIDAGRPVLVHVTDHTMLGYGYSETGQIIYIHDTWDYLDHQMVWGGVYEGLQHYGVTVVHLLSPLTITTQSIPNGTVGIPYSYTLQATGGTGTYSWSIISGSLPLGLSLDSSTGTISGNPVSANNYSFTAHVTDGTQTATKDFSITITTAYVITASAGEGGTVKPSGDVIVPQFGSQTFTITPDPNYHIYDVLVDGESQGAITEYTFENVDNNHTIEAYFEHNYIKFTTNPAGQTYSPTDTLTVSWDVEGFTGTEGKIKIFFFNATNPGNWYKWVEVTPSGGLDIADDSYLIDLSQFQIEDPLRCRLRIGISTPSGWLKWSDGTYSGTYFDETGYFWVVKQ